MTSGAISTKAARLAIIAIIFHQILLIALIFLRPDLAPSWHTISEWAIRPHGWIMSSFVRLQDAAERRLSWCPLKSRRCLTVCAFENEPWFCSQYPRACGRASCSG